MKMKSMKGFTLTELLIVMAIVVVLAAVAIPTFGKQLETSRETGDMEIIRNAYSEAVSVATLDAADGKLNGIIGDGGDTMPSDATKRTWGAVSCTESGEDESNDSVNYAIYQVLLSSTTAGTVTMGQAKFAQAVQSNASTLTKEVSKQNWTYVKGELMDRLVPSANVGYTKVKFRFELDENGTLGLAADTGTGDNILAVAINFEA